MQFFRIQPQRPCDIWTYSRVNSAGQIEDLVFAYDFPSSDSIYQDVPHYFVRASVGASLVAEGFTGFELRDVRTRKSANFAAPDGWNGRLESVCELLMTGIAGQDDVGRQRKSLLVVSEPVLVELRRHGLVHARVFDYDPDYRPPTLGALSRRGS
jgi:hypothetical protein